ncbi:MAG TPA: hypothetical protein VND19_03380 [Acetobacteraceae bacterium]|nr:hypothetical protein [Acetobacteraceae bacterium]
MKKSLFALLLLSLALAGCVVEPGGGYRGHGWDHGGNGGFHGDHGGGDR